jgi:hypothetical protein
LEATIKEIQNQMDESFKAMAIHNEAQLRGQKQVLEDLEVGNLAN